MTSLSKQPITLQELIVACLIFFKQSRLHGFLETRWNSFWILFSFWDGIITEGLIRSTTKYWLISFCLENNWSITQLKESDVPSLLWKDGSDPKIWIKQKFEHFFPLVYLYKFGAVNEHPRLCRKLTWLW